MKVERGTTSLGIVTRMLRDVGKEIRFRGVLFDRWGVGILTLAPKVDRSRDAFGNSTALPTPLREDTER